MPHATQALRSSVGNTYLYCRKCNRSPDGSAHSSSKSSLNLHQCVRGSMQCPRCGNFISTSSVKTTLQIRSRLRSILTRSPRISSFRHPCGNHSFVIVVRSQSATVNVKGLWHQLFPCASWIVGRLSIDEASEELKLKGTMHCPLSGVVLTNIPSVKAHLASSKYLERLAALPHTPPC